MSTYQELKDFMDFKKKTGQEISYGNYYFQCGKKVINSQEYSMSDTEESFLHGLYLLYEIKLDSVLGHFFRESRSVEFQKDFYTKLFIYEKIHQMEKENKVDKDISSNFYDEYVVELNTTDNIDGEQTPKTAMDMFFDFAKEELKEDKEFLKVIHTFCNSQINMTFSSVKEERNSSSSVLSTEGEKDKQSIDKNSSKLKVFCKKFTKNTVR